MTLDRRQFLVASATGAIALASRPLAAWAGDGALGPSELPSGARASAVLVTLPGKVPLIKRSFRPPNYETPLEHFNEAFTPNKAFFVRYHLAVVPKVDRAAWRLRIGGDGAVRPLELTLDELRRGFEQVEVSALCLCAGNRRGLSDPHVPGIQWGHGAMGNARWKGVRLRDLLNKAGVRPEAIEVAADGADVPLIPKTPDFRKSVPIWKALDENTLVAFEMNGEPLPDLHGAPARLVVSGWTATYWMKHLTTLDLVTSPEKSFWMTTAYRVPRGVFPVIDRFLSQETEKNTPITEMVVSSLITNLEDGSVLKANEPAAVRGVAWDGGVGIREVLVSIDGGKTFRPADLGPDLGRYAWRQFSLPLGVLRGTQELVVMSKATNRAGGSQTSELLFNPAGYNNNVVQRLRVKVA